VGLFFQPRRTATGAARVDPRVVADAPVDRPRVLVAALEAVVLGDASRFAELFSEDVEFTSPHLSLTSRGSLQRELGVPEDSLSDIRVVVLALDAIADKLIAEWRLEAMFTRPVLLDDRMLIEPTGRVASLSGVSIAEFRGRRIRAFRHYFDDSELLAGVPGPVRRRYSAST
jgi:ketosteroid isomerase-like protein